MGTPLRLSRMIQAGKSVFKSEELKILWRMNGNSFRHAVKRMVDKQLLFRISKGIFSLGENYNVYELANVLLSPSYISLHSAFVFHHISFQPSEFISSVSFCKHTRTLEKISLLYFKVKDSLLYNLLGIETHPGFNVASPERALLDSLYLGFSPNLDREFSFNESLLRELIKFYPKTVSVKANKFVTVQSGNIIATNYTN